RLEKGKWDALCPHALAALAYLDDGKNIPLLHPAVDGSELSGLKGDPHLAAPLLRRQGAGHAEIPGDQQRCRPRHEFAIGRLVAPQHRAGQAGPAIELTRLDFIAAARKTDADEVRLVVAQRAAGRA